MTDVAISVDALAVYLLLHLTLTIRLECGHCYFSCKWPHCVYCNACGHCCFCSMWPDCMVACLAIVPCRMWPHCAYYHARSQCCSLSMWPHCMITCAGSIHYPMRSNCVYDYVTMWSRLLLPMCNHAHYDHVCSLFSSSFVWTVH